VSQVHVNGVVFDLDGTLYVLRARKLRLTLTLLRDLNVLRHLSATRAELRATDFSGADEFYEALYGKLGQRAGISPTQAADWYKKRFLGNFVALLGRRAKTRSGLVPFLTTLGERNIRLAVVSDYPCVAERLEALGLPLSLFNDLSSSEDYGALKPSPKPFLALARKWGVEPATVLVVGDRKDLDEASARAAGMAFLGIRDGADKRGEGFVEWPEAMALIRDWTG
jgi:HAD superfamily hydrolase (TIGR01549 family)